MLFALLETQAWTSYVLLAVLIVIFVLGFWWSGRMNKKKQEKEEAKLDALGPGNKVKTIGGICGIIVAVDKEEGTFVLETGDTEHGKCYLKILRQAIYQTDVNDAAVAKSAKTEENAETAEEVIAEAEKKAKEAIEEKKD